MRWRPWLLTVATLAAIVLGGITASGQLQPEREIWPVPDSTVAELDRAFTLAPAWVMQSDEPVVAGITPHHALVSPIIAAWFLGLKTQPAPTTVVIIGPDHHNAGAGYITTATTDWQTPDGIARVDRTLVTVLAQSDDVVIDPKLIRSEHGVYTAIPYIYRVWPRATIVTLAIKGDRRPDRLQRLASRLDQLLGKNDLVIATVDFSHYRPAIDALLEDQESLSVIARGDVEGALGIPVDSPPAISLILRYEKIRQLNYRQLVHTTSAQFTGQLDAQSTTSYVSAYFVR